MDILLANRFWQPSAAMALHHTRRSHHSVVSSWWWTWNCPKHNVLRIPQWTYYPLTGSDSLPQLRHYTTHGDHTTQSSAPDDGHGIARNTLSSLYGEIKYCTPWHLFGFVIFTELRCTAKHTSNKYPLYISPHCSHLRYNATNCSERRVALYWGSACTMQYLGSQARIWLAVGFVRVTGNS